MNHYRRVFMALYVTDKSATSRLNNANRSRVLHLVSHKEL